MTQTTLDFENSKPTIQALQQQLDTLQQVLNNLATAEETNKQPSNSNQTSPAVATSTNKEKITFDIHPELLKLCAWWREQDIWYNITTLARLVKDAKMDIKLSALAKLFNNDVCLNYLRENNIQIRYHQAFFRNYSVVELYRVRKAW